MAISETPTARTTPEHQTISVVICTRHRPRSLTACVRSVAGQTAKPAELIVVDDGELPAGIRDELSTLCASSGIPFLYLKKTRPGLTLSRNLAVDRARGDVIQFLDDDVTLEPTFLREIVNLYAADPTGALLGSEGTLIEPARRPVGARLFETLYRIAGWWALRPRRRHRPPRPPCLRNAALAIESPNIVGATMAFRRTVLLHERFDESLADYALGEDRDMACRLGRHGWIARCLTARARHHHDPAGRPAPFRFGRMTVHNYLHILTKNGMDSIGELIVIAYSLAVVSLAMACFSIPRPRRYLPELCGILSAAVPALTRLVWRRLAAL